MSSLFLSASQIHDGKYFLPSGSVLELSDTGKVIATHTAASIPEERIQHYEGIICPGFINAHCHVELSHMKGVIPEGGGLLAFLLNVTKGRQVTDDRIKLEAALQAQKDMVKNGIVAIGDIANTSETIPVRAQDQLHWHTFVEAIGFLPERATTSFSYAEKTLHAFNDQSQLALTHKLLQSIVPHAPYSVSEQLFTLIGEYSEARTLSVHNQEMAAEDAYYIDKSGGVGAFLNTIGINDDFFQPSGKSSLQTYTPYLGNNRPLLLVHNTYTSHADRTFLKTLPQGVFACLCPKANWYIERKLPDIDAWISADIPMCIGTDSLASNNELNIWSEVQFLHQQYPHISTELLLRMACYNGAVALQLDHVVGSFTMGFIPGVIHIDDSNNIEKLF